jgi:Type IV secretion system pilin
MRTISATIFIFLILSMAVPVPAMGAGCAGEVVTPPTTITQTLCLGMSLIQSIIPIIMGATLLVFIFGIIKFIRASGDSAAIAEGRKFMIWGVIALFVMLSIWGILNLFYSDIFGGSVGVPQLPQNSPSNP